MKSVFIATGVVIPRKNNERPVMHGNFFEVFSESLPHAKVIL